MTRLTPGDINTLSHDLIEFDKKLKGMTGRDMLGIACHGAGIPKKIIQEKIENLRAAAVTMTCGQGQITGFSQTLKDILTHLGFAAFVPGQTDAAGIAQALENKADILFMADDHRYIALNLKKSTLVDNAFATGNVFAAALDLMAKGLKDKSVLVLGCGPVGRAAAQTLIGFGALVGIHDKDMVKCENHCLELEKKSNQKIERIYDLLSIEKDYCLFVEATNGRDVITSSMIGPQTHVAAPGVPLGVSARGIKKAGNRILYDPLQLGTAAMAVMAILPL